MAFTMDTSRTADAAKLAVLWRDRDKQGGAGVPDRLVRELLDGALLPPVSDEPQPLSERPTIFGDADAALKSLYLMVADLRAVVASPAGNDAPGPTDPLAPLEDDDVFRGGDLRETLRDVRSTTTGKAVVNGQPIDIAELLRSAEGQPDQLSSLWKIVDDLRLALCGITSPPPPTERVTSWVTAQGLPDEVPMVGLGVYAAFRSIVQRLDSVERRLKSLEDRP